MARYLKRLQRELKDIQKNPPEGIEVEECSDISRWVVKLIGVEGTLYAGQVFRLQFKFAEMYPMESPEVMFIGEPPVHPHIYTNGHICLSILYDNWSPALTAASVCVSILSMLSSNDKLERPPDNDQYTRYYGGKSPKDTRWVFHDDTV